MTEQIIPFGKYKNKPLSDLLADTKYFKWCEQNNIFDKWKINIYNINVSSLTSQDAPTPEHNKLQNAFFDKKIQRTLVSNIIGFEKIINEITSQEFTKIYNPENKGFNFNKILNDSIRSIKFEEKFNWDIVLNKLPINLVYTSKYINEYKENVIHFILQIIDEIDNKFNKVIELEQKYENTYNTIRELYNKHCLSKKGDLYILPNKLHDQFFDSIDYQEFQQFIIKDIKYSRSNDSEILHIESKLQNPPYIKLYVDEFRNSLETILQNEDISKSMLKIDPKKRYWENELNKCINNCWASYRNILDNINKCKKELQGYIAIFKSNECFTQEINNLFKDIYDHHPFKKFDFYKNSICCELKTSLGDEYPCVLRKMISQLESTRHFIKDSDIRYNRYYHDNDNQQIFYKSIKPILIIKEFNCNSASLQEIQNIFNQHSIKVILFDSLLNDNLYDDTINDIEIILIKRKILELEKELKLQKNKLKFITTTS